MEIKTVGKRWCISIDKPWLRSFFQVSGLRIKGETRWPIEILWTWRILRSIKIRMLNGLEKTLERKVPERERRWQLAEETAVYGVKNESFPQGWPITTEHVSWHLTPETWQLTTDDWNQIAMTILANNSFDLHPNDGKTHLEMILMTPLWFVT